jgi:hypothetical protein
LTFTFPPLFSAPTPPDAINIESLAAVRLQEIDPDRIHDAAYDHDRESILSAPYSLDDGQADSISRRYFNFSDTMSLTNSRRSMASISVRSRVNSATLFAPTFPDIQPSLAVDPLEPAAPVVSRDNVLSAAQLMRGASEYVVIDKSRVSAFSPRELLPNTTRAGARTDNGFNNSESAKGMSVGSPPAKAQETRDSPSSNRKGRGDSETSPRSRAALQLSMLPNQHFEVDLRSLNLHLRARVVEVLACTESMWDWVRDLQRSENERGRGRIKTKDGAIGGFRRRAESARRAMAGKKPWEDAPGPGTGTPRGVAGSKDDIGERVGQDVKEKLLKMNREQFDEMIMRFRLCVSEVPSIT